MLDYFGQSPIIVRSSSLLEDSYGNAFAGKYESVFCPNQGPHHRRLEELLGAVKTVYASTMSEKALRYRAQRGLLDQDEQMSLLVQRVSGVGYGSLFYPQVAGVALSRNPYVWNECIDPAAGVVRLVFGLGTRAVDRTDDDYTRIVALNAPAAPPGKRPGRSPPVLAAEGRRDRPGGEPVRFPQLRPGGRAELPPAGAYLRLPGHAAQAHGGPGGAAGQPRPGAHFRRVALADPLRRRHARDAPNLAGRLRLPRGRRVHRQFPPPGRVQDQPGAVPAAASGPGPAGRRAAQDDPRGRPRAGGPRRGDRPEPREPDRPAGLRRAVGLRRSFRCGSGTRSPA